MRYFRDLQGQFRGIDQGQEFLIRPDWVEVTKADIDKANEPTAEQIKLGRIEDLKDMLAETDFKDLPSYDKRDTPEWEAVMQQRQAWRQELRQLLGEGE